MVKPQTLILSLHIYKYNPQRLFYISIHKSKPYSSLTASLQSGYAPSKSSVLFICAAATHLQKRSIFFLIYRNFFSLFRFRYDDYDEKLIIGLVRRIGIECSMPCRSSLPTESTNISPRFYFSVLFSSN
ncbi:hypothetical protein ACP275_10G113500 [Erythranthe tilingii]